MRRITGQEEYDIVWGKDRKNWEYTISEECPYTIINYYRNKETGEEVYRIEPKGD